VKQTDSQSCPTVVYFHENAGSNKQRDKYNPNSELIAHDNTFILTLQKLIAICSLLLDIGTRIYYMREYV